MMEEKTTTAIAGKNSSIRYFTGTDRYAYWRKQ